jgi:cell division protein FtsB
MQTNRRLLDAHWQEPIELNQFSIWEVLRQGAQLLVLAIGCTMALVLLWPTFEKGEELKREIEQKDKLIAELQLQRDALEDEYQALLNDPRAVEREARDLLNLAREGETIFRFAPYEHSAKSRALHPR